MATHERAQLKKQAMIEAYKTLGTITHAAEAVGINRSQHYDWMRTDPDYVETFHHAEQAVGDTLEKEALRRAVEGTERIIYHQGVPVGAERQFSDTLLIFLLKGHKPDKYKDRAHITGEVVKHDPSAIVEQAKAKVLQFLPGGLPA